MAHPLRNVALHWHRLRRTRERCLDGIRLVTDAASTPTGVRNALLKNTYEDAERALVARTVQTGDRVLEISGGIGFVRRTKRTQPVIRANHARKPITPELRMKAMSGDGGPVTFHVSDHVLSSSMQARRRAEREVTVESDALRDVLAEHRPDVVVMDVEGAEIDLLPDTDLNAVRALVLELHPDVVGEAAIDALLADLRAQGFSIRTKARSNVLLERA